MNRIAIPVVAALIAAGCAHVDPRPSANTVPGFPEMTVEGDGYPADEVGLVVFLFTREYERSFGKHPTFDRIRVKWVPSFKNPSTTGVTSYGTIFLLPRDGGIWHTALTHELMHVALERLEGDADPDHERDEDGDGPVRSRWTVAHNEMIARLRAETAALLAPRADGGT